MSGGIILFLAFVIILASIVGASPLEDTPKVWFFVALILILVVVVLFSIL